jgi:hypothetical protein
VATQRHPVFTWRVVLDETAYTAVLVDWRERHNLEEEDQVGF